MTGKIELTRLASAIGLTIALLVAAPLPALGAEELVQEQQILRDDIQTLIDDTRVLLRRTPSRAVHLRELQRAERLMRASSDDGSYLASAHFREELGRFGGLMHQLAEMVESLPEVEPAPDSTGFPNAFYPQLPWEFVITGNTNAEPPTGEEEASAGGYCSQATVLTPEWKIGALNIALAAEGLRETFSRICQTTIEPLCIVTDIAYIAGRGVVDNMFLCDDLVTEAEVRGTYLRLAHLHDDIETVRNDIATRLDLLETRVVSNLNANEVRILDLDADLVAHHADMVVRTDQIAARIAALTQFIDDFRAEDMRMEIETALADADNKAVGTFQMPVALGGHLELVHALVVDTINRLEAAGQGVGNARSVLTRAEAHMAAGEWDRAYQELGGAYRAAAR